MEQKIQSCDLFLHFEGLLQEAIERLASLLGKPLPQTTTFSVEIPKECAFGDLSTNAAMILAKEWKLSPREIVLPLQEVLGKIPGIASISMAGVGFLNITLTQDCLLSFLRHLLVLKENYGRSEMGQRQKVNIEYVSANPTGPLHAGHLRGAVTGDVLATLLAFTGFDVTREYYINDAGHQIDVLVDTL
ncbi:MAG: arginine--tRNA ligase, partial [Holosporales bacterium]|nr:arginine--tRNA ligase [Holosporales bacterium]